MPIMSDIPCFIFIRNDGDSDINNRFNTAKPVMNMNHHHNTDQHHDCDASSISHDIDMNHHSHSMNMNHHDASDQDLVAMKQMIAEMSQDPTLIRERCSIPQLSQSMAVKYQQWAACQQQPDLSVEEDCDSHHSYCYSHDGNVASFRPRATLPTTAATPPRTAKRLRLAPSSSPDTPETHELTALSTLHNSVASQLPPIALPLSTLPYYCQECNSSPTQSEVLPPVQLKLKQQQRSQSFRSSFNTSLTALDFPAVVAMARSA